MVLSIYKLSGRANVVAMKPRHSRADISLGESSLKLFRRCFSHGIKGGPKTGRITKMILDTKKVEIKWHRPKSWIVLVRVAERMEPAGV